MVGKLFNNKFLGAIWSIIDLTDKADGEHRVEDDYFPCCNH